jgi:hypothetical protein
MKYRIHTTSVKAVELINLIKSIKGRNKITVSTKPLTSFQGKVVDGIMSEFFKTMSDIKTEMEME